MESTPCNTEKDFYALLISNTCHEAELHIGDINKPVIKRQGHVSGNFTSFLMYDRLTAD